MDFWLQKEHDESFSRLGKMLGVTWDRSDFVEQVKGITDKVNIPLAVSTRPEILDVVKKLLGKGDAPPGIDIAPNEQVVELGDYDDIAFKDMLHLTREMAKDE